MILTLDEILKILPNLRAEGKKIVFTNGCFDILHSGHVFYLDEAKALGDVLILGLNSDDSVRRLKGEDRPLNSQDDRALVINSLRAIDYVVIFNEDTPFNLISEIKPDILVKGGDYKISEIVGADVVQKNGGLVTTIKFVEGKSTTAILEKIKKL